MTHRVSRKTGGLHVVGLFAGIGGIELGLSRAGHSEMLLCEIDRAATAVLRHRFKSVPLVGDIRDLDELPAHSDLVAAGFPCQDLSQAGATRGIRGAQSGLIGEVFRLLQRHSVPWVLIENVPFMLQLARGEALEVILSALEHLGYRWAYRVVDSRSFGLPQRRRRVYMLASLTEDPRGVLFADDVGNRPEPPKDVWRDAACGFYWTEGLRGLGWAHDAVPTLKGGSTVGIPSPPAIVMPDGRIVTPDIRDAERLQGFDADWTKPAENVEKPGYRWKLVGNAVTVDAAHWIGSRLLNPGCYDDAFDLPLNRQGLWPTAAWNLGSGRMVPTNLSEWPFETRRPALSRFLQHPVKPLSERAARGFYSRASRASLRFPPGFLEIVRGYCKDAGVSP